MKTERLTEEHIRIAADLYRAREAARNVSGAAYEERLVKPMEIIQAIRKRDGVGVLDATMIAAKRLDRESAGMREGFLLMWLFAACVEISERGKTG